jgi:hypothetical protein
LLGFPGTFRLNATVPCQGCASAPNHAAFMVIPAPGAAPYGLCGYRCSTMQVRVQVTPFKT